MSSVCLDHKGNPYLIADGCVCGVLCSPCILSAAGFAEKLTRTDIKVCFVISSTIAFGSVGAGVGALSVPGAGSLPGFGIGCAIGFTASIIKVAIDEFR